MSEYIKDGEEMKTRIKTFKGETNYRGRQKMSAVIQLPAKEEGGSRVRKVGQLPAEDKGKERSSESERKMNLIEEEPRKKMDGDFFRARQQARMEKEEVKCQVVRRAKRQDRETEHEKPCQGHDYGSELDMIFNSECDNSEGGFIVSTVDEEMRIGEYRSQAFLFAGDAVRVTTNGNLHLAGVDGRWMLDRFRTYITFKCKEFKDMVAQEFNGESHFMHRIGPFGCARYPKRSVCCALYADGTQQQMSGSTADSKMLRMTNISCTVWNLAVVHVSRFNDPSPSAVMCFDLKKRIGIVIKALWRNMRRREDGKYEMDVLFDNSEDAIPKSGNFIWFLMFPRDIEKIQVQLNNYCNFFVGRRQITCKFGRSVVVGDALQAVNFCSLNKCHAIALDRKTGQLVVVVDKEDVVNGGQEGIVQQDCSSEPNTESSDAGIEGCSTQFKQSEVPGMAEEAMPEGVRLEQENYDPYQQQVDYQNGYEIVQVAAPDVSQNQVNVQYCQFEQGRMHPTYQEQLQFVLHDIILFCIAKD